MEIFKIEHFERAHPGKRFPPVRTLADSEANRLRAAIASKLGMDTDDGLALVHRVASLALLSPPEDASEGSFSLADLLQKAGVEPETMAYINWYRFDRIDAMAFDDLSAYFDDIWYPASDDIEVFDNTLNWIVVVCHEGRARLLSI